MTLNERVSKSNHKMNMSKTTMTENKLLRMDNVGIVVESLDDTISFFYRHTLFTALQQVVEFRKVVLLKGLPQE
jgi:hypothetical protein